MTFAETAAELSRLLNAGYGLSVLSSFEEGRGLQLAQVATEKLGLPLSTWTVSRGMTPAASGPTLVEALTALRRSERPGLLALLGLQLPELTVGERRMLREMAAEGPAIRQYVLVIAPIGELPDELQREAAVLELSPPDETELKALLEETAVSMNAELGESAAMATAAARGLGIEEARRVFRRALVEKGDLTSTILAEKRRLLRRNSALDCIDLGADEIAGLSLVGGLELLKQWLANRQKSLSAEARAFGIPPPKGLLLMGVQGCGKSLSAKAVAAEWRMPLCRLDLAGLLSDRGSSETALRQAIASVEAMAPVVLWIDELEKGFAGVEAGQDVGLMRLFGWFITWLGERSSPVFVVATANDVANLPPELLRKGRFDETFFVDLPGEKAREEILAIHLRRRGRDPEAMQLASLSKRADKLSGSELEQLVVGGLHLAFAEGRELNVSDLWQVLGETVPLYRMYAEKIRGLRNERTRTSSESIVSRMPSTPQLTSRSSPLRAVRRRSSRAPQRLGGGFTALLPCTQVFVLVVRSGFASK
jgi:SpoVK/Ycf46/Vps4 family AAA+-type ATPase